MFGLSLGHIIVLAIIVLIFGPKRVSGLMGQFGKIVRDLRENLNNAKRDMGVDEVTNPINEMRDEFSRLKEETSKMGRAENTEDIKSTDEEKNKAENS